MLMDRQGRWVARLEMLDFKSDVATYERMYMEAPEVTALLAKLSSETNRLCAALTALRGMLAAIKA